MADKGFSVQGETLQRLCAMTFWLREVASAATDLAIAESLKSNPVAELVNSLERLRDISEDWIQLVSPGHVSIKSGVSQHEARKVNVPAPLEDIPTTLEIRDNHVSGTIPVETQVTQNYTAWASHIIEEYQRGLKDGRRSAANQLKEWAAPRHAIWPGELISKCDDLMKEKP